MVQWGKYRILRGLEGAEGISMSVLRWSESAIAPQPWIKTGSAATLGGLMHGLVKAEVK